MNFRKLLALILCLALCLGNFSALSFADESVGLRLEAVKTGDQVKLTVSVDKAVEDVYAIELGLSYDGGAFVKRSVSSPVDPGAQWGSRVTITPAAGKLTAGQVIAELRFDLAGGFSDGTEYRFAVSCEDAIDSDGNDLAFGDAECILQQSGEPTTPPTPTEVIQPVEENRFLLKLSETETSLELSLSVEKEIPDIFSMTLLIDFDQDALTKGGIQSSVDNTAQWGDKIVVSPSTCYVGTETAFAVLSFVKTAAYDPCAEYRFLISCEDAFDNEYGDILFEDAELTRAAGHDWGEPSYTWAEDNSSVTAERSCKNNAEHVERETVTTDAETFDPDCETAGRTVYTAVFANPAFETQSRSVEIAALGHIWSEPEYTWAEDNSRVTAKRVCTRDTSHVEQENAAVISEVTKAATCEGWGETSYTASFDNPAFETQKKTLVDLEPLGHAWGEPEYTWAEDNSSVTAKRVCTRDASHIEQETAAAVSEVTKAATCESWGETSYTADFANPAFETQKKTLVNLEPLGHIWGEPEYFWAEDNSSVTAKRVCARDGAHEESETAVTTLEILTAPTFEAKGLGRYTAVFENPAFETQTKDVVLDELTGYRITIDDHSFGKASLDLDPDGQYHGAVSFTVSSEEDIPLTLGVRSGDGYIALKCTTEDGVHRFTVEVEEDMEIAVVVKGDAQLDGRINMRDSLAIKKTAAGTYVMSPLEKLAAEADDRAGINMRDSLVIKKNAAGTGRIVW